MEEAARAIALRLKWSMTKVRELVAELEADGVHLVYRPTTGDLCPCTYHYATESGLCVKCETKRDLERQQMALEEEERRLEAEAERDRNAEKKRRQRVRERYDANPRKSRNREEEHPWDSPEESSSAPY